jgi:cell division protein ZapA (FtsZ GTPase activity inhibitor)
MENDKIEINGKEYDVNNLTDSLKYYLNQANALDQKIRSVQFDMDQLVAAKIHFINLLTAEVEKTPETK